MIFLLSLACYSPEVYTVTVGPRSRLGVQDTAPPPEEQVSTDVPPPDLTASAVESQINTLMSYGVVEPVLARDSYLSLHSQGDGEQGE